MAKKSNKTAHVLNLISNSKHIAVETDNSNHQAGDIPEDIHPTIKNSLEKAAKSEALSNKIKENLEKEFAEEHKTSDISENETNQDSPSKTETENTQQSNILPDTEIKPDETQPENENINKSDETQPESENINESDEIKNTVSDKKAESNTPDLENTSENIPSEAEGDPQSSLTAESSQNIPSVADDNTKITQTALDDSSENSTSSTDENDQKADETEFIYLNVCEELVRDKVHEYMDRFNECKCKRCVADTMALALTNLPPKYVVLNNKNEIPFISFYENKYRILLMTELTKACLTVNSNPRHKKD